MREEITEVDIRKIQEELTYRKYTLRPQLHEEVKRTREYGDLSENDEYRCAKRERNRNESRIRYLERFLLTARVVKAGAKHTGVGLFDFVEFYNERTESRKRIQLVTGLRQDALRGLISKESPLGRALWGHGVGERVRVEIAKGNEYYVVIEKIEAGEDNEDLPIRAF